LRSSNLIRVGALPVPCTSSGDTPLEYLYTQGQAAPTKEKNKNKKKELVLTFVLFPCPPPFFFSFSFFCTSLFFRLSTGGL